MSDPMTCGKGLAEHSALPRALAQLAAAMAGVLEMHQTSLDANDPDARAELGAYATLTGEFGTIATSLERTATRMAGYRDLPMPEHDPAALASPRAADAFAAFVGAERELLALLQGSLARDEAMLAAMRPR